MAKFDDLDRKRVIDAIEEHYGVKLDKVARRRKWLRDESGRTWWVLGGVGDWHGIPKDMWELERSAQTEGMLVIAEKKRTALEVFVGPVRQLVGSIDKLRPDKNGARHFTVRVRGDHIRCDQVPGVVLERLLSIPHSDEDRERERRTREATKTIADLTPEQVEELLENLEQLRGSHQ